MRIVNSNYNSSVKQYQKKSSTQSFKGEEATVKSAVKAFMHQKTGKIGWWSRLFENSKGEVQTQLGNAAFTTTLAPLVIRYNPFSNQDKDTRAYSAWRQPLSALIAIGIGWPLTTQYGNWMQKMAMNGDINSIDLRIMKPDSEYSKDFKAYIKEQGNGAKFTTLNDYAKDQNENVAKAFAEKYIYGDPTTTLEEAKEQLKLGKLSQNEFNKLEQTYKTHNLHNLTLPEIMEKEFKFKFTKVEGENFLNVDSYEKKLGEIKATDFLKKLGLVDEDFKEETLRLFLLDKKEYDKAKEIADLKNIKIESEEFEQILKEIKIQGKLSSRNIEFNIGPSKKNNITLGQFLETLGIKETFKGDLDPTIADEIKEALKEKNVDELFLTKESNKMSSVLMNLKNKLKGLLVNGKKLENGTKEICPIEIKKLEDFAIEIAKNKGKRALKDFSSIKGYTSIVFNLVLTAISCTALNWAYPRVMDALFPRLSESKKKGGTK